MASALQRKPVADCEEDALGDHSEAALSEARHRQLSRLLDRLECYDPESSKAEFGALLNECQAKLELEDSDFARLFRVSRPTVNRWVRAETAPHSIARRPVVASLVSITKRRLRSL